MSLSSESNVKKVPGIENLLDTSGSELAQKPVSSNGEGNASGQHSGQKPSKCKYLGTLIRLGYLGKLIRMV